MRQLFMSADNYQQHSLTQRHLGMHLIDAIELVPMMKVLDVGCGNGVTTLQLLEKEPTIAVDAIDISDSMIKLAKVNMRRSSATGINFFVQNIETYAHKNAYDMIFSNAALHWASDGAAVYKVLYDALRTNGSLAVHQGGFGCYRGLHSLVHKAIAEARLTDFADWSYPIFYPRKEEMERILISLGFLSVRIVPVESDGSEYPSLVEDFLNAGMLPYFRQLPDDKLRKKLKDVFLDIVACSEVDTYSNRLYIFAKKGH
jgi:SAM-dependent methyltransferase